MARKHNLHYNAPEPKRVVLSDEGSYDPGTSRLNMFDPTNPDIALFDVVDGELGTVGGSEMLLYRYTRDEGSMDSLYEEHRGKVFFHKPVSVYGHYDPRPIEENLSEFGIELTNDQIFTFNKRSIENAIQRILHPGDVIKPKFQETFFEVFEVQEDSFEAYGVYHLVCSAKILRDIPDMLRDDYIDPTQIETS